MKKKLVPIIMALGILIPTQAFAATGDSIVKTGEKYLGRPYSYGAPVGVLSRFDCSSLTAQVFKENGITLPRVSSAQARTGTAVSKANLQKGDLVFFDTDYDGVINHVGIYAGSNQMINASSSKGVSFASLSNSYWKARYVSARRVLSKTQSVSVQSKNQPTTKTVTSKSTYTVVKGDTLWKISKKKGSTVAKIKSANHLRSDLIRVGQKLTIPR